MRWKTYSADDDLCLLHNMKPIGHYSLQFESMTVSSQLITVGSTSVGLEVSLYTDELTIQGC